MYSLLVFPICHYVHHIFPLIGTGSALKSPTYLKEYNHQLSSVIILYYINVILRTDYNRFKLSDLVQKVETVFDEMPINYLTCSILLFYHKELWNMK